MSPSGESTLHAALLKRATERIEELEGELAAAPEDHGPDIDALKRVELQLRDQQAEIAARLATMSGAYQQLVAQLRTMSVSLQELAALSTAFSEALDALESTTDAAAASVDDGFSLDVPAERRPQSTPSAPPVAPSPPPEPVDPDAALAAAADALLVTLADVEATLDEALEDAPQPPPSADSIELLGNDEAADDDPVGTPAGGSRYSRRSARLPRLGDAAQQEALATAKSMRNVFSGD